MSKEAGDVNRSEVGDVSATPHEGEASNAILSVTPLTSGLMSLLLLLVWRVVDVSRLQSLLSGGRRDVGKWYPVFGTRR